MRKVFCDICGVEYKPSDDPSCRGVDGHQHHVNVIGQGEQRYGFAVRIIIEPHDEHRPDVCGECRWHIVNKLAPVQVKDPS